MIIIIMIFVRIIIIIFVRVIIIITMNIIIMFLSSPLHYHHNYKVTLTKIFSSKGSCQKKTVFLGYLSQICLPTHPPLGFCEIWENER